jgi:lipoprotein-anchoring transpeptidase ErfK/SrfK
LTRRLASVAVVLAAIGASTTAATAGKAPNAPPKLVTSVPRAVSVGAGAKLSIRLSAPDPNRRDSVHIGAFLLPQGASLAAKDGNPAQALFRWTPLRGGTFVVTFSAQDHGSPRLAVTRAVKIVVRARPVAVSSPAGISRWAFVQKPVAVRTGPNDHARVLVSLGTRTPEGSQNLALVLARIDYADGRTWYEVRLPILPNNSTGWVPASAFDGLHPVATHLVVDREKLVATLYRLGRPIFRTPVGVGQSRWPTPAGQFYVRDLVLGYRDPFYGPAAFGTSARSRVLTDWPKGGYIGIHGTNQPGLLPGRVSHGCIRMPNSAIQTLRRLMPIGTPLTIR